MKTILNPKQTDARKAARTAADRAVLSDHNRPFHGLEADAIESLWSDFFANADRYLVRLLVSGMMAWDEGNDPLLELEQQLSRAHGKYRIALPIGLPAFQKRLQKAAEAFLSKSRQEGNRGREHDGMVYWRLVPTPITAGKTNAA